MGDDEISHNFQDVCSSGVSFFIQELTAGIVVPSQSEQEVYSAMFKLSPLVDILLIQIEEQN